MNLSLKTFEQLLATQNKFDSKVKIKNGNSTKVAYLVELIEWINTLEFFKDWKKNKGKPLEMQLDELADLLAFGLSIGLHNGLTAVMLFAEQNEYQEPAEYINTDMVLYLISELSNDLANGDFIESYLVLLPLMLADEFYTTEQLLLAYHNKMQINHERQESGY